MSGCTVPVSTAPSATALGKRHVREYAIDPQAPAGTQFLCAVQIPFFPSQASTSSHVQNFPDAGVLPEYNCHISYSPSVNSSTFNAAYVLEPKANVHQPHSAHTIGSDPALTYLPGYRVIVSIAPVAPMQWKLQDVPVTEPGEGTKFVTAYTLNKQSLLWSHEEPPPGGSAKAEITSLIYHPPALHVSLVNCMEFMTKLKQNEYGFSRTQSVRSAVPVNSVALTCTDIPKLVQLYRYFTVPTLSDGVARHRRQTSIRISSLASILAEHQCAPACPGYNDVFVFHRLKRPRTVKHNLGLSSHFFEVVFDNSPRDDGPGIVSTYNLNRHFEFVTIGEGPTMELMYGNSTGHSICRTSRLADFIGHFVHLNIGQLNSIARAHAAQAVNFDADKPALIQSLMRHVCSDTCGADHIVIIRRLYLREGQFNPHSMSEELQAVGGPTVSMSDLEVLPILMDNHMQVEEGDGRDHVSTYLLNASFNFVEILSATTLRTHKAVDF
ncbi:hypothetical protein DFH08DRAFT_817120 [Mycena albidolilacea]|uniref:Uncharacterized protein n=1 Tax=Mycena albidolilacea TaxID=1033008 RepID=A0AAD6ZJ41_9AGAR|nr:hypothetical protein DFH08DRAFT_817120 [Mycena albidolilacea]